MVADLGPAAHRPGHRHVAVDLEQVGAVRLHGEQVGQHRFRPRSREVARASPVTRSALGRVLDELRAWERRVPGPGAGERQTAEDGHPCRSARVALRDRSSSSPAAGGRSASPPAGRCSGVAPSAASSSAGGERGERPWGWSHRSFSRRIPCERHGVPPSVGVPGNGIPGLESIGEQGREDLEVVEAAPRRPSARHLRHGSRCAATWRPPADPARSAGSVYQAPAGVARDRRRQPGPEQGAPAGRSAEVAGTRRGRTDCRRPRPARSTPDHVDPRALAGTGRHWLTVYEPPFRRLWIDRPDDRKKPLASGAVTSTMSPKLGDTGGPGVEVGREVPVGSRQPVLGLDAEVQHVVVARRAVGVAVERMPRQIADGRAAADQELVEALRQALVRAASARRRLVARTDRRRTLSNGTRTSSPSAGPHTAVVNTPSAARPLHQEVLRVRHVVRIGVAERILPRPR